MLNVGFSEFSKEFVEAIAKLNKQYPSTRVTELFGSLRGLGLTARAPDRIPAQTRQQLKEVARAVADSKMAIKWTLNASCFGRTEDLDWRVLREVVRELLSEYGIRRFIVSVPLLAKELHLDFPDIEVEVSTISRITSIKEMLSWFGLGASSICWDVMQNRNFRLLADACMYANVRGKSVEVLANEFCTFMCVYRNHCYSLSSHGSGRAAFSGYPFAWCTNERLYDPWQWIATRFVLPEHLEYYQELGVGQFKIAGRTWSAKVMLPIIEAYMRGESPRDLLELWPHVSGLVGMGDRPAYRLSTDLVRSTKFLDHFKHADCFRECQISCKYCNSIAVQSYEVMKCRD